jgi:hypothetical protein
VPAAVDPLHFVKPSLPLNSSHLSPRPRRVPSAAPRVASGGPDKLVLIWDLEVGIPVCVCVLCVFCVCVCVHVCVCMCSRAHVHVCMYICMCVLACACMCAGKRHTCRPMRACARKRLALIVWLGECQMATQPAPTGTRMEWPCLGSCLAPIFF